jgi:hypoxanthine phosphoribosyltransferase
MNKLLNSEQKAILFWQKCFQNHNLDPWSLYPEVKIIGMENLDESIRGKNILIVEDIIDTGRTMQKLLKTIAKFEPKSVTVACLLRKRTPLV